MAVRPKLYSMAISHYCVCAEKVLALKGVEFDRVAAPYHDRQALLKATGQDYVPALVWNGKFVPWDQIAEFVEREVPSPTLYADGQRGIARALDSWGHGVLEERVWRSVVTRVPTVLGSEEERWVFEEMQTRARGPWSVLQMREKEFRAELHPYFGMVESMLVDRPWVLGEPSLADCGIFGGLSPWLTVGEAIPREFPNTRRWADRMRRLGG